ncbi:MAG: PEP-CTERM sorting domain-containing protein [Myxococcota bacterium]
MTALSKGMLVSALLLAWCMAFRPADAHALTLPLSCSQIQGAIVFGDASSFPSTSGGCSTESYSASIVDLIEGSQSIEVSLASASISHSHQAVRGGSAWAVYSAVSFSFEVPANTDSIQLTTSYPQPVLDEYVLQIQGSGFSATYWNEVWVVGAAPPPGLLPLPTGPILLAPGSYSGYFRFATYTPTGTGSLGRAASLSIEANVVPEPSTFVLFATGCAVLTLSRRK